MPSWTCGGVPIRMANVFHDPSMPSHEVVGGTDNGVGMELARRANSGRDSPLTKLAKRHIVPIILDGIVSISWQNLLGAPQAVIEGRMSVCRSREEINGILLDLITQSM